MYNNNNSNKNYDNHFEIASTSILAYNDAIKEVHKIIANTISFFTKVFR